MFVPHHKPTLFAGATLIPVALLILAAFWGGAWTILALFYMTFFTYMLDMLIHLVQTPDTQDAEFPAASNLSIALAISHLILLIAVVWSLTHQSFQLWEKVTLFWAAGLFFGQVSNSNAHELVHRSSRLLRFLGKAVYISTLFGHHASAHTKVHHIYVATDQDPNSATLGQSAYRFIPAAWWGSFKAGYSAENAMRARAKMPSWHPYTYYCGGAVLGCLIALAIGNVAGLMIYISLGIYATIQLLLSDYVQHYGLRRTQLETGKYEPVGVQHSWNSPHWFSAYLMLNAPKHSDHHAHPITPFFALEITDDMPMLPRPLPAMATLALCPPLWRRVMDRRVKRLTQT
jgi:alkane 1-monooxygenase